MSDDDSALSRTPAEIERDIARTRVELAQTVNAIEDRLNAGLLVKKGFDMLQDRFAGGDAVNRGLAMVRENPVPFALFGIGAAWLIAANTNVVDRVSRNERVTALRRRATELASDFGSRAGALASDVAEKVGIGGSTAATDQPLGHTGHPMVDQLGQNHPDGWVHQMSDMAQDAIRSARDAGTAALDRAGSYAGDGAARAADSLSDTFQRHPLLIGAIGAMAGALVAALLPLSRTEERWIGSTRDEIWRTAEELGREAVTRMREAAVQAASGALDAASAATSRPAEGEIIGTQSRH